jgi:hypothetical protein
MPNCVAVLDKLKQKNKNKKAMALLVAVLDKLNTQDKLHAYLFSIKKNIYR